MKAVESLIRQQIEHMDVSNLSGASSVSMGGGQLDGVSGASSYVPTSASTTDPAISQMRADIKQNSQDFQALKSALQSNNLTSASQAFTSLQQMIQNASQSAGGKSPFAVNSPIGNDFQAVGTALSSGDLSAAKHAFAAFRQDIKIAGRAAGANQDWATNDGTTPTSAGTGSTSLNSGNSLDVTA